MPALETRHTDLLKHGDKLFSDATPMLSLWQEIAENFYVERAFFTASPILGRDMAAHLSTSYPIIARRDLGNAFSAMLRPRGKSWFSMRPAYGEADDDSRRWLERARDIQRNAMYDRSSQFVRATKEGDHDFAAFGQCVLSAELTASRDALLYRCWHLRDVVWAESADGTIGSVHRRWNVSARELKNTFGEKKLHSKVTEVLSKEPFREFKCRHIVVRSSDYEPPPGKNAWKEPFVSLYLDVENNWVIEETGIWGRYYIIPRWQTVSGSQYAYSPATVAALPDARLIQAMTFTLLQAGERAADPPMIATQGAIKSDIDLRAGGITWSDAAYDEKLGEALRPVSNDKSGIPYGLEMRGDAREMISEAFYLNQLSLPPVEGGKEMTAYEAGQRVQDYIRKALPLFEPMEDDYNGQLCEESFGLLLRAGGFGPRDQIPQALRGAEVQFHFESPLQRAEQAEKGAIFQQGAQLLAAAAQIDPGSAKVVNAKIALRDALYGIGSPSSWVRSEDEVAEIEAADAQRAAHQQALQSVMDAAHVGEQVGKAGAALKEAAPEAMAA